MELISKNYGESVGEGQLFSAQSLMQLQTEEDMFGAVGLAGSCTLCSYTCSSTSKLN